MDAVVRSVVARCDGTVPEAEVRRLVEDAFGVFAGASVRMFVPVLVERAVRERLLRQGRRRAQDQADRS